MLSTYKQAVRIPRFKLRPLSTYRITHTIVQMNPQFLPYNYMNPYYCNPPETMNGFDYNTQLPQQYIFQPYDPWAMYYPGDPSNTAGEDFISSSQDDTTFNSNTLVDNSPNDQDEQLHTSNVNDEANQEIRDRVIELEAYVHYHTICNAD